jgi:chemotaxis protein CheD
MSNPVPIRSKDRSLPQVGDFYDKTKRYYDNVNEHTVVKIFTGDCYVTRDPREMLITILGSCIAVCMRDPLRQVGGMNHILLPGGADIHDLPGASTRYGAFAMEELINGLLKLGAEKSRLECKVFGGAQVMRTSTMIGERNIAFVHDYLANEGIPVAAEDVGGDWPRRIHYFPQTGRVRLRRLHRKDDMRIADQEQQYVSKASQILPSDDNIELFD